MAGIIYCVVLFFVYNHSHKSTIPSMLTALPTDLLFTQIIARLPPADRWRLRFASNKIGGCGGEPDLVHVALETMILVTRVGSRIPFDSGVRKQVDRLVIERLPFDCLGPLRRWFRENRVCLDEGGFYTPLGRTMRVRIGLWETGVVYECRPLVKWVRGMYRLVQTWKPVAREGFEVYAVV